MEPNPYQIASVSQRPNYQGCWMVTVIVSMFVVMVEFVVILIMTNYAASLHHFSAEQHGIIDRYERKQRIESSVTTEGIAE